METNQETSSAFGNFKRNPLDINHCNELIAYYESKGLHHEALQTIIWKVSLMREKVKKVEAREFLIRYSVYFVIFALAIAATLFVVVNFSPIRHVGANVILAASIGTTLFQLFITYKLMAAIFKAR